MRLFFRMQGREEGRSLFLINGKATHKEKRTRESERVHKLGLFLLRKALDGCTCMGATDDLNEFDFLPNYVCVCVCFVFLGKRDWQLDPHFKKHKPLLKDLPIDEVQDILNDPAWTKAAFFRDPSKRLLR